MSHKKFKTLQMKSKGRKDKFGAVLEGLGPHRKFLRAKKKNWRKKWILPLSKWSWINCLRSFKKILRQILKGIKNIKTFLQTFFFKNHFYFRRKCSWKSLRYTQFMLKFFGQKPTWLLLKLIIQLDLWLICFFVNFLYFKIWIKERNSLFLTGRVWLKGPANGCL